MAGATSKGEHQSRSEALRRVLQHRAPHLRSESEVGSERERAKEDPLPGGEMPLWAQVEGLPSRAIAGRVVAAGKPIPGALVRLSSGMLPFVAGVERQVFTNGEGRFRFQPQAPTNWILSVSTEGYAPEILYVDLRAGEVRVGAAKYPPEDIVVEVESCQRLVRGFVRDRSSMSVAGAVVGVTFMNGVGGTWSETNASGGFELCVPGSERSVKPMLVAAANGYGRVEIAVPERDEKPIDLVLESQAVFAGRVVIAGTEKPAPLAKVTLQPLGADKKYPAVNTIHAAIAETLSGADGTFQLSGLAPGAYRVEATNDDARLWDDQTIQLKAGDVRLDQKVVLWPTTIVEGRIVRKGAPIPWSWIWFYAPDPGPWGITYAGHAMSLADGRFRARMRRGVIKKVDVFDATTPKRERVELVHPAIPSILIGDHGIQDLTIELPPRPETSAPASATHEVAESRPSVVPRP